MKNEGSRILYQELVREPQRLWLYSYGLLFEFQLERAAGKSDSTSAAQAAILLCRAVYPLTLGKEKVAGEG